MREVRVRGTIR